ncbi:hypothetical protein GGX14DRAFT_526692 [Mycena pura]|uniref:Meiotically up-regulated protein Msb1/Mug8 domain-containing protein n=1 Tax=Mycena pura TaxID=153505 RepID=A0AAD6UWN5_9AGAR|nr:hypothetical protein GGX14DRAFT_526692 [Mycena pura]
MPSLFSRARTASTPSKAKPPLIIQPSALPASGARDTALSLGFDEFGAAVDPGYGAVGFLPTTLPQDPQVPFASTSHSFSSPTPSTPASNGSGSVNTPRPAYGLLSPARDTVLGLTDAARLTGTICGALERTNIATPFMFSALALDARRAGVVRLAQAFLATCADTGKAAAARAEERWMEEARFAGAHELALCLRWGLSRVVRVEGGRELRGLLSWAWYERWRAEEAANNYPPTAFSTFIDALPAQLGPILGPLFALCVRLVAHSAASGHTPPTLASILSPLLFGLSPPPPAAASSPTSTPLSPTGKSSKRDKDRDKEKDDPEALLYPTIEDFAAFSAVYEEYIRGARAAEHLLLACIREDVADERTLGGPTRLREWVGMYPASVEGAAAGGAAGKRPPAARRGAKTVRVVHVKRNVRSYSSDLVKTGSAWAEAAGAGAASGSNDWGASKAWRSILAGGAGAPRYTEPYRKRMDFGLGVQPSTASLNSSISSATSSPFGPLTSPSTTSLASDETGAFRSLTDLQWGAFESLGFDGRADGARSFELVTTGENRDSGIEARLKFDLTENARAERLAKRETLTWSDFTSSGFTRSDAPLSATLQFAPPLSLGFASSPPGAPLNAELTRKLRKAHKALPAFGWDTAPVLGPEEVIEEAFLDVFCDLLYGGGWMERAAGVGGPTADLARECAWALVEYKSRSGGQQDPGATLVLFEEFVPREYRLALAGAAPPGTRRRLPSLFTPSPPGGGKTWKQAATLNGRPYVLGATPAVTGSSRELDFDSMLRAHGATKMISLSSPSKRQPPEPVVPPSLAMARTRSEETNGSSVESGGGGETPTAAKRHSTRFRLPGGMIPGPSPGGGARVRPGMVPAEFAPVDFQTRLAVASESDDEEEEAARQRRRESASDAWVDILVGSVQARRMPGQDAQMPRGSARRRGGFVGSPDPALASMEVAQALAAETMGREMSLDGDDVDWRHREREERLRDSDVVEIERIPRTSEQSGRTEDADDEEGGDDDASDGYGPPTDTETEDENDSRRRMGYFDLHPERRPASVATKEDDDPRSLLSQTDSEDDHEVLLTVPRNLDVRPLPIPTPSRSVPAVDVSDHAEERRRAEAQASDAALLTPTAASHGVGAGNGHAGIAAPAPAAPSSKTSALIDMFREREQQQRAGSPGKPVGPVPPSRLPVRTAAAPLPTPPAPKTMPLPAPPAAPLPKPPASAPAPAPAPVSPPKSSPPQLDTPPVDPLVETGRASPARYVHGAPLHNVVEESEEE